MTILMSNKRPGIPGLTSQKSKTPDNIHIKIRNIRYTKYLSSSEFNIKI